MALALSVDGSVDSRLAKSSSHLAIVGPPERASRAARRIRGAADGFRIEVFSDCMTPDEKMGEVETDMDRLTTLVSSGQIGRILLATPVAEQERIAAVTFLEAAKSQFDSIVIDSPPAVVVADAAILARFADVVLHVVRWGQTRRSDVLDAVDRMHRANGKAVGVTILNRVSPAKYSQYNRDGGSGFRYADYYRAATTTTAAKQ